MNDFLKKVIARTIFIFGACLVVVAVLALMVASVLIFYASFMSTPLWLLALIPCVVIVVAGYTAIEPMYKKRKEHYSWDYDTYDIAADIISDIMTPIEEFVNSLFEQGDK